MKFQNNKEVIIIIIIMLIFSGTILILVNFTDIFDKKSQNKNNKNNSNYNINTKDLNDKFITCVDKYGSGIVISNKECIITDENENTQVFNTKIPFINIEGKKFNYINKLFIDDFNETNNYITYYRDASSNKLTLSDVSVMDYKYYINDNIISLIIKKKAISLSGEEREPQYKFYNIDKVTGDILSNDELLDKRDIKLRYKISEIKDIVKQIYEKEMSYIISGTDVDSYVEEYYEQFGVLNTTDIYLNSNNKVTINISLPVPFWTEPETYSIELDNNTIGYSKQLDF